MAKPTLVSYTEVTDGWTGVGASRSSASVAWQTNDVIVVLQVAEGEATLGLPSATGLVFQEQKVSATAGCYGHLSAVVAGGNGSSVVTCTHNSAVQHWGFGVWVYRDTQGLGNSAEQHTTTKTVSLTPIAAHSAICYAVGDYSAEAVHTMTPTPTTVDEATQDTGRYTIHVGTLEDQVSGGAVDYGVTGGTSTGPYTILVMEVRAGTASDDLSVSLQDPVIGGSVF